MPSGPAMTQANKPDEHVHDNVHEIKCEAGDSTQPQVQCGDEPVRDVENRQDPTCERAKPKWHDDYIKKVTDSSADLDFCYRVGLYVPSTFEQARD